MSRRRVGAAMAWVALGAVLFSVIGTGITIATGASVTPVVVIVMENEPFANIVGNLVEAPFENSMISNGMLFTNYKAVMAGSKQNYLAMTSGNTTVNAGATNLFAALGNSEPWGEFEESMPSTCYTGTASTTKVPGTNEALYQSGHNPASFFTDVTSTSLCSNVQPLTPQDFSASNLPAFSFVVPNYCDDTHTMPKTIPATCPMWNGGDNSAASDIQMGDNWLSQFVPAVAANATVILTWDEGNSTSEQVVTLEYGAGVTPGTNATAENDYSLESGLYRYFGLGTPAGKGAKKAALPIP